MSDTPKPQQLDATFAFASERLRQVTEEGFDKAHDAEHSPSTLLAAAACYLNHAGLQLEGLGLGRAGTPEHWPWNGSWWKPADKPDRNLIKGGALAMAALDRYWDKEPVHPEGGSADRVNFAPEPRDPAIPQRARELLEAAYRFALAHPEASIHYDEADCDGACLAQDIKNVLDYGV